MVYSEQRDHSAGLFKYEPSGYHPQPTKNLVNILWHIIPLSLPPFGDKVAVKSKITRQFKHTVGRE